tara:strand:- start:481 stop:933 length:453 start_codon:yes stop_codon:yes gene_type:complete
MYILRKANFKDNLDIFNWRNDETSRKMFFNTKKINWKDHCIWFESNLNNNQKCLLICSKENNFKVAIIRFDLLKYKAKISVNLNPSMRGKGHAVNCLNLSLEYLKNFYPNIKSIIAEIKSNNIVSIKTFEKIGFIFIKSKENILHYEKKL